MKKKMEKLDDPLFQPLTAAQQKRITAGITTTTATTLLETDNPFDFVRDGDRE